MLTENDIVKLLSDYLKNKGYQIQQSLATTQKGIDIIARNENHTLYIEAKGETSSMQHTNRFGSGFDAKQIKSHVSRAILTSMIVLQQKLAGPKTRAGIALPDTPGHRELIAKVSDPLRTMGIKVFLVSGNGVDEYNCL
jgi:hypothetical protein